MPDILDRLADVAGRCANKSADHTTIRDAIAEITQLRTRLSHAHTAGDQLAHALARAVVWECCGYSHYGPCDCPGDSRQPTSGGKELADWNTTRQQL